MIDIISVCSMRFKRDIVLLSVPVPEIQSCVIHMGGVEGILNKTEDINKDYMKWAEEGRMAIDCIWNITVDRGKKVRRFTFICYFCTQYLWLIEKIMRITFYLGCYLCITDTNVRQNSRLF